MASSAVACRAGCGGQHCIGPQLRTLDCQAAESSTFLFLERCRTGPSPANTPGAGWRLQKQRLKLGVVMNADSGQPTSSHIAALSLPFGKKLAAVVPAEPATQMHVVQRGQVMSKIAQLYETDLKTLHELNPGVALDYVRPKQTIVVPKLRTLATAGAAKSGDVPEICPPKGKAAPFKDPPPPPVKAPAQSTPAAVGETGMVLGAVTASGELQYVVQPGDSLFIIAEKYGVSMTELVKLNKLHFKSTIRPQQTLRIPANSKPQAAAVVANVCPAPPPTCPAPSRRPQTGWALGLGLALLGAAVAVYAYNLVKGKKLAVAEKTPPPPPAAEVVSVLAASPLDATDAASLQAAKIIAAIATPPPSNEAPVVSPPAEIAASPVAMEEASVAPPPQAVAPSASPPSQTVTPLEPIVASTSLAETEGTTPPLAPTEFPTPSLPEAASVESSPPARAAPGEENGRAAKAPVVVSDGVMVEAQEQQPEPVTPEANASAVTVNATEGAVPEVTASTVIEEVEVSPSVVIKEEEAQNGAAVAESVVSSHEDMAASDTRVSLTHILPDGLVPLETTDVAEKQPEHTDGQLGVGSSFCQEATITRALQGAYRAASQSLGPLHQTLAFVALSSGRIGLASEDFTWGSTAEAVVALRSTLPADCNLQGICTWGVTGADGKGAGEEKEWAAVLLFSALGRVVASGSTITTGSPRLAAEMAAEGLRAKAVGKKLKAVIIVSSPQAGAYAVDVVRDVIPGLPVYAISESKVPDSPGRPVALSKEWQVAPAGAASAVAPGISLVGVTTDADFGGAFFATVVGQWLYGPKCTIEALPSTAKEMAASGR